MLEQLLAKPEGGYLNFMEGKCNSLGFGKSGRKVGSLMGHLV